MNERVDGVTQALNLESSPGFYGIPTTQVLAIEQFMRSVTVPLFTGEDARVFAGTGSLFAVADRHFIVTAAHVVEEVKNPAELACPEHPVKGEIYSLGSITVARPQKSSIDVAVMEMTSPETITRMREGWRFLGLRNIRAPHDRGVFVLSGFPVALGSHMNGKVLAPMATVYTERLLDVPTEAKIPVDPTLDLFFHYDKEGVTLSNHPFTSPSLKGASGGSVWEYTPVRGALWSPEAAVKVIGVQSAFLRDQYFRAKNWGCGCRSA
jgi:hypothetical protein